MYSEFEDRNTVVIAVAQEDTELDLHARMLKRFGPDRAFEVVADLNREVTLDWDRTTTYLIDTEGVVREIFPAMIHMRPSFRSVLNRLDEIQQETAGK